MKKAIVRYVMSKNVEVEGIIIENEQDLSLLEKDSIKDANRITHKFVKSNYEKFDIHFTGSLPNSQLALGVMAELKSLHNGKNPIHNLGYAVKRKIQTVKRILSKGQIAFLNPAGGVTSIDGENIVLVKKMEEVTDMNPVEPVLVVGSRVINLENDCQLEKNAIEYMKNNYFQYSYITQLREYSDSELKEIFVRFKENGGETVYIYTSGYDVPQMYDYSKLAIAAGLNHFIFEFTAGHNKKINRFLKDLGGIAKVEDITKEQN